MSETASPEHEFVEIMYMTNYVQGFTFASISLLDGVKLFRNGKNSCFFFILKPNPGTIEDNKGDYELSN